MFNFGNNMRPRASQPSPMFGMGPQPAGGGLLNAFPQQNSVGTFQPAQFSFPQQGAMNGGFQAPQNLYNKFAGLRNLSTTEQPPAYHPSNTPFSLGNVFGRFRGF